MLLKLIRDHKPDFLAITWDPKGGSFRDREFPDYKGTRAEMPDALRAQMPHFHRIADAFHIPYLVLDDFEADDVMGTLARRHEDELDVVLVSSDKDLMQLVSDHVTMFDSMKDRHIGFPEVEGKFGCRPERVPDALGIWGDSSDNIPGVRGIGEKGVKQLLADFDGLDDIYRRLEEVTPPGTRAKLEQSRDSAFLSKHLATIRTDAPVEVGIADLALDFPPPVDRARELFSELEFRSLLREFGGEMEGIDRAGYRLVTSDAELDELRETLSAAPRFALDTETTSLDPLSADLVGLSFCCDRKVAWYVPVAHASLEPQLDWDTVSRSLGPILSNPASGKTGQNLKYDLEVLHRHGVELAGIDGDTLLADYLLSPDRRSHKLDDLALIHLEHRMIAFKDTVGKSQTFADVQLEAARDYAAEDAHVTWLLDALLTSRLEEDGLDTLYRAARAAADRGAGEDGDQRDRDRPRLPGGAVRRARTAHHRRPSSGASSSPGSSSTSARSSSCARCFSTGSACRSSRRPRPAHPPTSRCSRSSPSTTRCHRRFSTTARWSSSRTPTSTRCRP